jgi:imidazolonepropionase-like amidohydrolase
MLLTARRLFDARTPTVLDDRVVEVEGGRIVDVRARGQTLVDAHQHLVFDASDDADIVAAGGNPLDDLTAVHDVRAVFVRGSRAELRRASA